MSEDILLIVGLFSLYWGSLFLLLKKSSNKKPVLLYNSIFHFGYSLYSIVNLLNLEDESSSLGIWIMFMFLLLIHWIIITACLLILIFKKMKNE